MPNIETLPCLMLYRVNSSYYRHATVCGLSCVVNCSVIWHVQLTAVLRRVKRVTSVLEYSLVHGISYYSCSYSCDGMRLLFLLRLMGDISSIRGMLLAGEQPNTRRKPFPVALRLPSQIPRTLPRD
jgi:hypothetical protein